jgi:PAS domain S-box-containing protein
MGTSEELLLDRKEFAEKVLTASLSGLVLHDLKRGVPIYVNPEYTRLTGYTLDHFEKMTGNDFLDLFHPEDRPRVGGDFEDLMRAGEEKVLEKEYRFKTADGRWIWCMLNSSVFEREPDGTVSLVLGSFLDITHKRALLEGLLERERETRNRFAEMETIFQSAPVGLCVFDARFRYLHVNETMAEHNGVPAALHIGRTTREVVPGLADQVEEILRRVFDSGEPVFDSEITGVTPAQPGVPRTWLVHWFPLKDPEGNTVLVNVVGHEITERKEMERNLYQREQEFKALVENSPDTIVRYDRCLQRLYVNPSLERLYELPASDLEGRVAELINVREGDTAKFRSSLKRVFETGEEKTIYQDFYTRHGKISHQIRLTPEFSKNGAVETVLVIGRDISALKRLEEDLSKANDQLEKRVQERTAELEKMARRLKDQQEIFQRIMDHIPVMVTFYKPSGEVGFLNREAREVMGIPPELLDYTDILNRCFPDPKYRQEVFEYMMEAPQGWRDIKMVVQGTKEIQATHFNTRLSDGSYLGIGIDITERKKMEEKLQVYTRMLEASNQALQDFASVASHDLQEPLRKIRSFGELLKERYRASLDDTGKDYVDRMHSAAERMGTLIEDLLEYSRVSERERQVNTVDLNQILQGVLADLEVRIKNTKARIQVGHLPTILADPTQIRQVFQNLIGNALKFRREDPVVKISGQVNGPAVEIRIEDNGIGFDEKDLIRIFRPFQRLHGRSQYEGVGMGLAIVQKIVERHNGTITARSTPGKGTTFIIRLPL